MRVLVYDTGLGIAERVPERPGWRVDVASDPSDLAQWASRLDGVLLTSALPAEVFASLGEALARRPTPLPWVMVVDSPKGRPYREAVDAALRQGVHEVIRWLDTDSTRLHDALEAARSRADAGAAVDVSAARLASVGRLAAGLTRQLSNPATYVLGNLTVLEELLHRHGDDLGPDRREVQAILADCREGMGQLQRLAQDLAVLARLQDATATTCVLHEIVDRGLQIAEASLEGARVIQERSPGYEVHAQGATLAQVIASLVLLLAASAPRAVRVRTRVVREGALVEIVDTQAGVTADDLHALLDHRGPEGVAGVELLVFRDALRAQGGDLRVLDEGGRGFQLVVPLAGGSEDVSAVTPEGTAPRTKVLVVDDDLGVLRMLQRVLKLQHEVCGAEGGRQAIEMLRTDPTIDFVLCDLMMPEVDGVAVHRFVDQHRPDLTGRFAILTGGAVTAATRAFVALGAVPVISKPIDPEALLKHVRRQMRRSERRR